MYKTGVIQIIITDSGLGGLSIIAELYEWLKSSHSLPSVNLTFVNALPSIGMGYNTMPNTNFKISTFNNFLYKIESYFHPDLIGIACNTLSVLVSRTKFYRNFQEKVIEIIESSIQHFVKYQQTLSQSYVVILGTKTTIESNIHREKLIDYGISPDFIIPQSCPRLASAIEFNFMSQQTKKIIKDCVKNAVKNITQKDSKICIYLACTHYSYVANFIWEAFQYFGYQNLEIFNPNNSIIQNIKEFIKKYSYFSVKPLELKPRLQVFSRCKILPEEIASVSNLIHPISSDTEASLKNYQLKENLF